MGSLPFTDERVSRRALMLGAAGAAATGLATLPTGAAEAARGVERRRPLWQQAQQKGLVFGSSFTTWMKDHPYRQLLAREAGILFTEDDLLWWRLKPTPKSPLDFRYGDKFYAFAERKKQLVFAAHLVWDEGFGEGWTDDDLWGLTKKQAEDLLYPIVKKMAHRYKGRTAGWITANEVTDPEGKNGFRTNVPWYNTIGRQYINEVFHIAREQDKQAVLVLNEFGFETVNQYGDRPEARRKATLKVIDTLLDENVPVHALGVQGHLLAEQFGERFDAKGYRGFLTDVADRGLKILITELDVLDDGLPKSPTVRDRRIADVYHRYLDVTLDEPAVKSVMAFGLSDRYTWLNEDYPRDDGAARRPLIFDQGLRPKAAYDAVCRVLQGMSHRQPLWEVPR